MGGSTSSATDRPLIQSADRGLLATIPPTWLLLQRRTKREKLMRTTRSPTPLDLLTVSVEAGLGFDSAVSRVARNTEGPLSQEFAAVAPGDADRRAGPCAPWPSAASLDDLRRSAPSMVQADSLGIPIGRVLRIQNQRCAPNGASGPRRRPKPRQVPVRIIILRLGQSPHDPRPCRGSRSPRPSATRDADDANLRRGLASPGAPVVADHDGGSRLFRDCHGRRRSPLEDLCRVSAAHRRPWGRCRDDVARGVDDPQPPSPLARRRRGRGSSQRSQLPLKLSLDLGTLPFPSLRLVLATA